MGSAEWLFVLIRVHCGKDEVDNSVELLQLFSVYVVPHPLNVVDGDVGTWSGVTDPLPCGTVHPRPYYNHSHT